MYVHSRLEDRKTFPVCLQLKKTPTEFRVYVWDTSVSDKRFAPLGNVVLNGSLVSTVPEPSTDALAGLAFTSVLLGIQLRRES